jgi:preprotein translocase subunit SecA
MDRLGVSEGEAIHHPLVTRAISGAQRRVETFNFDIRKRLLEYDDVMNEQRSEIYRFRNEILDSENLKGRILDIIDQLADDIVARHVDARSYSEEWNWEALREEVGRVFLIDMQIPAESREGMDQEDLKGRLKEAIRFAYEKREEVVGAEQMRALEKNVMLHVIDSKWRDNLYELDALKEGIHFRAYAHKDPLVEYKTESFRLFGELKDSIFEEIVSLLFRIDMRPARAEEEKKTRAYKPGLAAPPPAEPSGEEILAPSRQPAPRHAKRQRGGGEVAVKQYKRDGDKVGRNDPCPCGSGKKYKKCCGKGRK